MGPRRCAQFTVDPAFVIVQLKAHDLVLRDKEERLPGVFIGSAFVSKAQCLVGPHLSGRFSFLSEAHAYSSVGSFFFVIILCFFIIEMF